MQASRRFEAWIFNEAAELVRNSAELRHVFHFVSKKLVHDACFGNEPARYAASDRRFERFLVSTAAL